MLEWTFDTRDAQAARRARLDFARQVHTFFGTQADLAAAELVLGELIGNAARHAPGPARVRATFDSSGVTIAVHDIGKGFSPPSLDRKTPLLSESGRGLAIVSRLADQLKVESIPGDGCCVRAHLGVRP